MSKVFVHLGVSLDGFMAGTNRGPKNPMGGRAPDLHGWLFQQRTFRRKLGIGDDGATGADDRAVAATFDRIGANILGKRMFDEGEASWPEEAPFHTEVFVLTHEKRSPWVRKGGTTFHFVNDGIEAALRLAREAAGPKDVRISGGGNVVLQYLNAGLVEELNLDVAPVLLGEGLRLFDGVDAKRVGLEIVESDHSPAVTHLRYAVKMR
jgi:dihydrofolate reductase